MTRSHERRGAALLLVLGFVVLLSSAAALVGRVSATVAMQDRVQRWTDIADDTAWEAERVMLEWLEHQDRVFLGVDSGAPMAPVMTVALPSSEGAIQITITAWDQCGLIPLDQACADPGMRALLPVELQGLCAPLGRRPNPGLDMVESSSGLDRAFPSTASSRSAAQQSERLGAWVTMHADSVSHVNLNTARVEHVEHVLRKMGQGGLEAVLAGRRSGVPSTTPLRRGGPDQELAVASGSTCWAFRTDVTAGSLRRAWWTVFAWDNERWTRTRRLLIRN